MDAHGHVDDADSADVFIPPGVEHFVRNDGDVPLTLFYAFSPPVVVGTW